MVSFNRQSAPLFTISTAIFGSVLSSTVAVSQESEWDFNFSGYVDARVYASDDEISSFRGGFGKVRYGGDNDGSRERFRINEVQLIGRVQYGSSLTAYANIQHNPDLDAELDIVEAFIQYRPPSLSRFRYSVTAGAFFPSLSFENQGPAWNNQYTLTNSAANTWFAEEVRPVGTELAVEYRGDDFDAKLTGGAFFGNDRAGTAIAFRGFVLNDQRVGLLGGILLPDVDGFRNDLVNRPFVESDDRPGFTLGLELQTSAFEFSAHAYDNRGDTSVVGSEGRLWDTEYLNVTGKTTLPGDVTFIAQGLWGQAITNPVPIFQIGTSFQTYSGLVSRDFGNLRVAFRAEYFDQNDLSTAPPAPELAEDGYALTAALTYSLGKRHRITAEYLYVDSNRLGGFDDLPLSQEETLLQLNYRLSF